MLRVLLVLLFVVLSVFPGDRAPAVAAVDALTVSVEQADPHASDCCSSCPDDDTGSDCCEEGCGTCCGVGSAALSVLAASMPLERHGRYSPLWVALRPVSLPLATGPPPTPPPIG